MVNSQYLDEDSGSGSESESNEGSRSPSPENAEHSDNEGNRSGSQSPASRSSRSRSHSQSSGNRSRSHSVNPGNDDGSHKSRSRSGTPQSNRSGSGSRKSGSRSRSGSQHSNRSRSGESNHSHRSGSVRSKSGTPHSVKSASGSRKSKSKSKSMSRSRSRSQSKVSGRASRSGSESGSDIGKEKRKRAILSDSGSEGEKIEKKKPKSALIDSESEEEVAGEPVDATVLFGDADDISSDEEAKRTANDAGRDSDDDVRRGTDHEDSDRRSYRRSSGSDGERQSDDEKEKNDPEPEPEPIPERRIDVEIPRIVTDLGKDIHFVKLPNFLSVETRPFDPETYEDEIDEEETLDEEGRQRIKLKVSNTIRWKNYMDDCGNMIKDSNARIVKWSDGSMSLHLGNEIFDVYRQPLQGDHNHLFIRQGTGLQGQAVFRTKLTFRPHSTESFTHKKMTMSLADRSQKTSGIKILTQVGHDPDADRRANLKKEEEKLRQAIRQKTTQNKPKRNREAAGHGSAYREYGEHDSDDEGAISIAAIKNKYNNKNAPAKQGAAIYSSDDDDSDLDARRNKKSDKSKALRALVDSDEDSASGSNKGGHASNDGAEDGNTSAD